jgi:uncharacterized protein
MSAGEVTFNDQRGRFELTEEGVTAFLVARRTGDTIDLVHTEVPVALEGRGIGGRIVQGALDHARTNDLTVVPTCPFVKSYLERHPEAADGVRIATSG